MQRGRLGAVTHMDDSIAHAEQIRVASVSDEALDALLDGERRVNLDLGKVWELRG